MKTTTHFLILLVATFACQQENDIVNPAPDRATDISETEMAYPGRSGKVENLNVSGNDNIEVELIDGQYILNSDILLTAEQVDQLKKGKFTDERTAISSLSKRWTNCKVYYTISPSLPNQARVTDAIAHWQQVYPWITFTQRTT
ncbi:MAG: hypothetical protein WBB45_20585 [Cyclobacteriaceae bacterium]